MSGLIRQSVGRRKAYLLQLIHKAKALRTTIAASISTDSQQNTVIQIEELLVKLQKSVDGLQASDNQWIDLVSKLQDPSVEENQYAQTAVADDGYLPAIDEASELIGLLQLSLKQLQQSAHTPAGASQTAAAQNNATMKLPKLELPKFNGDVFEWKHFWTVYEAAIHNCSFSGVQKFSYLRSYLIGPALDCVSGIDVSNENYLIAVSLLKSRFQRSPEQLIGGLYSKLKRLSPASNNKISDYRKTFDQCMKILRQLENAGEDINSNRSLVLDVLSKFPGSVLKDICRRKQVGAHSRLSEIQKSLEEYLEESDNLFELLDDIEPFHLSTAAKNSDRSDKNSRNYNVNNNSSRNSTEGELLRTEETSAFTVADKQAPRPTAPCYFCACQHFNSQCIVYPTLQERLSRLRELRRCTRCLRFNHTNITCRTNSQQVQCFFCKKSGDHCSPLCPAKFDTTVKSSDSAENPLKSANKGRSGPVQAPATGSLEACSLSIEEHSVLATAIAFVRNPVTREKQRVRLIFDNGSHRTYITTNISDSLKLPHLQTDTLMVSVFGTEKTLAVKTNQVEFEVELKSGHFKTMAAHTTPIITQCDLSPIHLPKATQETIESMKYTVADDGSVSGAPSVLVGSDYFWDFMCGTSKIRTEDGIYLLPTSLGIVLGGRCSSSSMRTPAEETSMLCLTEHLCNNNEPSLKTLSTVSKMNTQLPDVDEFWCLERIGIFDKPSEDDDEAAMIQFKQSITFTNGRYQVAWPWKTTSYQLPTNYRLALGRLNSLLKRLKSSKVILEEYNKLIQQQLDLGIIETVHTGSRKADGPIHYLPHHPVVRENNKTTKVRIVYDASSKCRANQSSLNECLFRGPVILPDLCATLLRFRMYTFVMTSDIEKAFLQLSLHTSQRDVTRFLWLKDANNLSTDNNIQTLRFARVPFGIISSPFLLGATVQHHLDMVNTSLSQQIKDNIYVDNVVIGSSDENNCFDLYQEAKALFQTANMNLREWCINSDSVFSRIPQCDRLSDRQTKVLGIQWDSSADTIAVKSTFKKNPTCKTKRDVLQAIASIFDPLGLFQPCTLRAKCFLRQIWDTKLGWDDPLSEELSSKWHTLHSDITPMFDIRLPRCVSSAKGHQYASLVVFSDASADAYAASVYLRIQMSPGQWTSNLIYAKSRLAPRLKSTPSVTIPRMELLGLLIAIRAANFVRSSLKITNFCHIFSKTATKIVENRLKEIRLSPKTEFSYVKSEDNPADICTRGLTGAEIKESLLWWHGPFWILTNKSDWPIKSGIPLISEDTLAQRENDITKLPVFHSFLVGEGSYPADQFPCSVDPSRFSSWRKLKRTTVWCLRFIKIRVWDKLTVQTQSKHKTLSSIFDKITYNTIISTNELNESNFVWVHYEQSNKYRVLIRDLMSNKSNQLINQLGLFQDNRGIIRCRGRLQNAELPFESIHPILLHAGTHVCNLIISDAHEKLFHSGTSHTLCQLRKVYWIPKGRAAVRRVLTTCIACKKMRGYAFALPAMPPLPRERVARSKPFEFTGLDYFGPIKVRLPNAEATEKMWVCLFTCLAIRAIHLEWVSDCSAQTFIDCISRFISRRGTPVQIISDNAPQFKLAKNIFDKCWQSVNRDPSVLDYVAEKGITWRFTCELAPWQGGHYERLIGIVKRALSSVIGRKLLTWNQFATLIAEVESIVNTRPLTYVGEDFRSGYPLRPSDFLTDFGAATGTPEMDPHLRATGGEAEKLLIQHWKAKQRRLDQLWSYWRKEYLTSLRERFQNSHKNNRAAVQSFPHMDEVVIVNNDGSPRATWKLARVSDVTKGADGLVRSASVSLPNGQVIRRPINLLYRLEVPTTTKSTNDNEEDPEDTFDGFSEDDITEAEQRHTRHFAGNSNHSMIACMLAHGKQIISNALSN